eukprot:gene1714-biopygen8594
MALFGHHRIRGQKYEDSSNSLAFSMKGYRDYYIPYLGKTSASWQEPHSLLSGGLARSASQPLMIPRFGGGQILSCTESDSYAKEIIQAARNPHALRTTRNLSSIHNLAELAASAELATSAQLATSAKVATSAGLATSAKLVTSGVYVIQ